MRWNKDDLFIELEDAVAVEGEDEVLIVASNIAWSGLPLELKDQVRKSDIRSCDALRSAVKLWAEKNGFSPG